LDENGMPRAFVSVQPSAADNELWDAMDKAAEDVALIFANGQPYEVLTGAGFQPVAAGQSALTVSSRQSRRDGLGTTHHEAGTLNIGDDPAGAVTNADARFHHVPNLFAAGPCLFPTVGSPNPMLTGTALARRLADSMVVPPFTPDAGFTMLFNGIDTSRWRMSKIINQPGRDNPGTFLLVDRSLESLPGNDLGMFWNIDPTPTNFILKLEWLRWRDDDNSGVFLRFPDPNSKNYK